MGVCAYLLLVLCLVPLVASQQPHVSASQWKTEQWGRCHGANCGFGGVKRRAIWCPHSERNADNICVGEKPPEQRMCWRVCPQHRTLFQWEVNDWGPCRQNNNLEIVTTGDVTSCGPSSFGLQERTVMCMEIATTYVEKNDDGSVPGYICEQFTSKPPTVQECITPCAQDCVVTQFSPWSACSKSCGNGTQTRSRRVVIPPSNGGQGCLPLSEGRTCMGEVPCEEDEIFTYSPRVSSWGPCQPLSGGRRSNSGPAIGMHSREVSCHRSDGKTMKQSTCFLDSTYVEPPQRQVCLVAVNCHVSGWSEWSPCSDPCSSKLTSHSVRQRSILQLPEGEGERCPELVQRRACSYDSSQCPRGRYVWRTSEWSSCAILTSSSGGSDAVDDADEDEEGGACGGGLSSREVFCTHVNDTTYMPLPDELCDASMRPGTTTHCHIPCPKSCRVGPWSSWGPCISFDCEVPGTKKAKGHISRARDVISLDEHGGSKCPHLSEHAPCNIQRCYWWATDNTTCQPSDAQRMCGAGMMTRNVYCLNSQEQRVESEAMCMAVGRKPPIEVTCTAPCPSDCVLGGWSSWDECSQTCEGESKGGIQVRRRAILAQPGPGGAACPDNAGLMESRNCNHHSCTLFGWMTTEWGECLLGIDVIEQPPIPDEHGRCGMGSQVRNVSCSRVNPAKIAPDKRCYGPLRPPSSQPCEVPCILDCVVSQFGDWTPCPTECPADGSLATQERRRYILQYPTNEGEGCPSLLREERMCNLPDACYTYTWLLGSWSEGCRLTGLPIMSSDGMEEQCGDGLQTRELQCERSDETIINNDLCLQFGPPMPPQSQPCRVMCSDDCQLTQWSPWSICHLRCTGSQTRRRRVHGRSRRQPECLNTAAYPEIESRPCRCSSYRLVPTGSWSDCLLGGPENEAQSSSTGNLNCGRGIKYRPVVCLDQEDRYVEVSHCGTSNDFMEEHCAIPCPGDCELGPWSEWRPCNGLPHGGIGQTTRWQQVLQVATEGGKPCPPHNTNWNDETKNCRRGEGRDDAMWHTDKWQHCEVSKVIRTSNGEDCGPGVQRRAINCVIPIEHGFRLRNTSLSECDASRKPKSIQACNHLCPGQCVVSSWTEWTTCPQDCLEVSFRTRNRRILRHPIGTDTGEDNPMRCPQLMEREECIPGINCFTYSWNATGWSPCQLQAGRTCGEGVRDRLLQCLRNDGRIVEVAKCDEFSTSAPLPVTSSCEISCPVDCGLTEWTPWSLCSKICDTDAVRTRHRSILQEANSKGRPCLPYLSQQKPCKTVPCYDWAITQWGGCIPRIGECGAGKRRRNVTCRQPNGVAVDDSHCLLTRSREPYVKNLNITVRGNEFLEREHYCEVPCPGECHYTLWSQWSGCHRTCLQGRPIGSEGIEVRSRASLTTDRVCSGDEWETRTCSGELCYAFEWMVGNWVRDRREVWCQRSDGLNVTGACRRDRPTARSNCNPECHIQSSYCIEDNRCVCDSGYKPIYSMTSGQLEACLYIASGHPVNNTETNNALQPGWSGGPGLTGELIDQKDRGQIGNSASGIGTGNSVNNGDASWDPQAGSGQKNPAVPANTTPRSPSQSSFLASLPPWVYAIAAVVVLLIVIVAIVLCCAKCAPKKKEEEKKPEPDYSMYWDETVQKKYTGEIEL